MMKHAVEIRKGVIHIQRCCRQVVIICFLVRAFATEGNSDGVTSNKEGRLYPNLQCHPGYYKGSDYVNKRGEKWVHLIGDMCHRQEMENPGECYKKCVLRWTGVLWWDPDSLPPASCMAGDLRKNFFAATDDNEPQDQATTGISSSAEMLANKIVENCGPLYSLMKSKPCSEWTPFYQCVDLTWDCP